MTEINIATAKQLQSFISQIERLNADKVEISDEIKAKFAEAKSVGFDPKTIRKIIKMRQMSLDDLEEQQAILDTYVNALGMLGDTPLGQYAIEQISDHVNRRVNKKDVRQTDLEEFTGGRRAHSKPSDTTRAA